MIDFAQPVPEDHTALATTPRTTYRTRPRTEESARRRYCLSGRVQEDGRAFPEVPPAPRLPADPLEGGAAIALTYVSFLSRYT